MTPLSVPTRRRASPSSAASSATPGTMRRGDGPGIDGTRATTKHAAVCIDDQYVARHGGLFPWVKNDAVVGPGGGAWLDPLVEAAPGIK